MLNNQSKMAKQISAEQLWQFSLQLYPQVKPLCLQWQDQLGANVNLLLLLCYIEQQQLGLTAPQLQQLSVQLAKFSVQFTQPLRALRRNSSDAALQPAQQQQLKHSLLQAELVLEQLEQQLLLQHCPALTTQATPQLLECYLAQLNADIDALAMQILDLRQACKRLSQRSS